jgi:transposase
VRALRAAFVEAIAEQDATRLRFLDETSIQIDMARRYGRAPDGQRCGDAVPHTRGANVTVVATLTPQGLEAVMEVEGALNQDVFAAYLEQVLAPELKPGDVILLDNLSAHKDQTGRFDAIVAACGARLLYLPPYSPDFSPIELAFSKLKTALRNAAARTREALQLALAEAINWITESEAKNWFDHCGYHVQ